MESRFSKAYDSLVRAFFEGTLAKFTCTACACGNIILDALGKPLTKDQFQDELYRMTTEILNGKDERYLKAMKLSNFAVRTWGAKRGEGDCGYKAFERYKHEVNAAGYTAEEFAKIETAFERNTHIKIHAYPEMSEQAILEDQYKGLCAVVDVLLELDKNIENPEELKQKFREHPKLAVA